MLDPTIFMLSGVGGGWGWTGLDEGAVVYSIHIFAYEVAVETGGEPNRV